MATDKKRRREALLQKAELVARALVAARLQSFRAARTKSAHPCTIHVFVCKGSGTLPSKEGNSNHLMAQPYGRLSVAPKTHNRKLCQRKGISARFPVRRGGPFDHLQWRLSSFLPSSPSIVAFTLSPLPPPESPETPYYHSEIERRRNADRIKVNLN